MAKGLFKQALGIFVELPEGKKEDAPAYTPAETPLSSPRPFTAARSMPAAAAAGPTITEADVEKFEAHFNQIFEKANLPGPDYFEFSKVMDTLEKPIPDERTRRAAAFASLTVQGLKKEVLLSSAAKYIDVITQDRAGFEKAIQAKQDAEISSRKEQIADFQKKIEDTNKQIQDLTRSITDAQNSIEKLSGEVADTEASLKKNEGAYLYACDAMTHKIQDDIKKIETEL
jgi:hypothetical protein